MKFDYAQESGGSEDIQDKGRAKKLRKASFGKPNFFERAKCTLGGCTAAPIFAWIIIHNRGQDRLWHWKTVDKGNRVGLESEKGVRLGKTKRNHDQMENGNVVCFYMEELKKAGYLAKPYLVIS